MSKDLILLPQSSIETNFCHDTILVDRCMYLFLMIKHLSDCKGEDAPTGGIFSYVARNNRGNKPSYGAISKDAYGDPIRSVLAKDLKNTLESYIPQGWKNKAIIYFINELPDELRIYIYWN